MEKVIRSYANTNLCDFRISGSRKNNFENNFLESTPYSAGIGIAALIDMDIFF